MKKFLFFLGLSFQLIGITLTGLCLFEGIRSGDYQKEQLSQFIIGIFLFYSGTLLKNSSSKGGRHL